MKEVFDPASLEKLTQATSLENLLDNLRSTNAEQLRQLFDDFHPLFLEAPGSRGSHHHWRGGWMDHNWQMVNIYLDNYQQLSQRLWFVNLPKKEFFAPEEGIEVILLHDIEKPFVYQDLVEQHLPDGFFSDYIYPPISKAERKKFREELMESYDITLNENQANALLHVEGVRDEYYIPGERADRPLAALCHAADNMSARIGYDFIDIYYRGEI